MLESGYFDVRDEVNDKNADFDEQKGRWVRIHCQAGDLVSNQKYASFLLIFTNTSSLLDYFASWNLSSFCAR